MTDDNRSEKIDAGLPPGASPKPEFVEPKLTFIEPKLTAHGGFTEVTGFFGTFVP